MKARWLAMGGAAVVATLALGLVLFVWRPGIGQGSPPEQPTPPPDPFITDTGVRQLIHRDFGAPTSAPNDIICQAAATLLLSSDGKVRTIEKAGRKVNIQIGDVVQAVGVDLSRLSPDISWPVRLVNGTLVLGWESCETPDGTPVAVVDGVPQS